MLPDTISFTPAEWSEGEGVNEGGGLGEPSLWSEFAGLREIFRVVVVGEEFRAEKGTFFDEYSFEIVGFLGFSEE